MWILTLRSPISGPVEHVLKSGVNTLGRKSDNDIVIADESASRFHAEIDCDEQVTIRDIGSTNGTFVNRERLAGPCVLKPGDQIRIGQHVGTLSFGDDNVQEEQGWALSGTQPMTRSLVLESVEHNSVLLYEISGRLSTIVNLDQAIKEVSELMRVMMSVDRFEVVLDENFDQLAEMGLPTMISKKVLERRSIVVMSDVLAEMGEKISDSMKLLRIRSLLCSPVLVDDEIVALIYAYKTDPTAKPFENNDVKLAVAIGHQLALTIQRTRLIEKVRLFEHWAITDVLTGLPNRRQTQKQSETEVRRALRFNHPLSLLMLDIDSFKDVNDTYGHPIGDLVLQVVTTRWRNTLRDIDLLGRYGGDEFIALLVETELDSAREVAELLRRCIVETPIQTDRGPLMVTVSVGAAALDENNSNFKKLLNSADDALYVAKRNGKNRVEVSTDSNRRN